MRPPEPSLFRGPRAQLATKPSEDGGLSDGLASLDAAYPKPVTIQHWQLRDLVHCPNRAGEVYAVNRHKIMRHDLSSCTSEVVCELSFEPTAATVSGALLAAGGQNSQLEIRRLEGNAIFKGHSGGSVNNNLRVAKDASGRHRLFVCNNDDTIKIFSVSVGVLVGLVRCRVAVNHCALSPDGQNLITVGDDRHTCLYQATPTGYRPLRVFTEATDAGMGCDWSPTGYCFASASQDGLTAVWDARTHATVARFSSPLACRNVRFSPAPLDVLAFTEHKGRCHVADARMWPRQQILNVSGGPELEPDISGLAFSPCGRRLYVGLEDAIVAYHVDTGARRSFPLAEIC